MGASRPSEVPPQCRHQETPKLPSRFPGCRPVLQSDLQRLRSIRSAVPTNRLHISRVRRVYQERPSHTGPLRAAARSQARSSQFNQILLTSCCRSRRKVTTQLHMRYQVNSLSWCPFQSLEIVAPSPAPVDPPRAADFGEFARSLTRFSKCERPASGPKETAALHCFRWAIRRSERSRAASTTWSEPPDLIT